MRTIFARNVNEAYPVGFRALLDVGIVEDTRNGLARVYPTPVTTVYMDPENRVLFDPNRDANPFFHLMEGLWMLAGRNDVEWISQFSKNIANYSDDGKTFHGAYGHRWRNYFKCDQINLAWQILRDEPSSRRCYVGMWDVRNDFCEVGKDFPCNVGIHFQIQQGELNMTVFNRSNDMIWGAYGANVVHMSMLQEYMAAMLQVKIGKYYQVSNNFHAYCEVMDKMGTPDPLPNDPYDTGDVVPLPMVENREAWMVDLLNFMQLDLGDGDFATYENPFFNQIAMPMLAMWFHHKHKEWDVCLSVAEHMPLNNDWRLAAEQWIKRRMHNHETRKNKAGWTGQKVSHDDDNRGTDDRSA